MGALIEYSEEAEKAQEEALYRTLGERWRGHCLRTRVHVRVGSMDEDAVVALQMIANELTHIRAILSAGMQEEQLDRFERYWEGSPFPEIDARVSNARDAWADAQP